MPVQESDSPAFGAVETEIDPEIDLEIVIVVAAGDWAISEDHPLAAVAAAFEVAGSSPRSLTISLSDDATVAKLNEQFRGKTGPTNVLSFPFDPAMDGAGYLGDIAIAFETVAREAVDEGVSLADRVTHMIVHGVLHLLGYDHENDEDATTMETLEVEALARLGIANPYRQAGGD
ncbi:MAG: rRNA maturation RNase YbeY [Alphaproteobacteria bacterium]